MKVFIIIFLQILLFIPVLYVWWQDCKVANGNRNLAVSLGERLFLYLLLFPMWLMLIFDS